MLAGARDSLLSRRQVEEVAEELQLACDFVFVATRGDKDKTTSLRGLEKSDFFTRELDEMLLHKKIDIAIHSAKDLPDPLPQGLKIAYLSRGLDPRDSLVYRMPLRVVGTSSARREGAVRTLFPDCQFIDIRGTIEERLAQWEQQRCDGVVIAECALIRLQLTHLPRIFLPGNTAPLQGQIAIVCRHEDALFGS